MSQPVAISVIMSVYNTDYYLIERAMNSVLNQDFQSFEFIIVDDGSNNDTQNLILNYAKRYEDKITYIRHKNRGQAESINQGVLLTKGEFITIIDADDEYKPHHLSFCLKEMQNVDLIASTTETIIDSIEDYYVIDHNDYSQIIHVDNCILFATLFGRREVFLDVKFQKQYASDANFYENASHIYRVSKVNLRSYIYYRNNPNSICSALKTKFPVSLS